MYPEQFSIDELIVECELRGIHAESRQHAIIALEEAFKQERKDFLCVPRWPHKTALENPLEEAISCFEKLEQIRQLLRDWIFAGLTINELKPVYYTKLFHVRGRIDRCPDSEIFDDTVSDMMQAWHKLQQVGYSIIDASISLQKADNQLAKLVVIPNQARVLLGLCDDVQDQHATSSVSSSTTLTDLSADTYHKSERAQQQHLRLLHKLHQKRGLTNKSIGVTTPVPRTLCTNDPVGVEKIKVSQTMPNRKRERDQRVVKNQVLTKSLTKPSHSTSQSAALPLMLPKSKIETKAKIKGEFPINLTVLLPDCFFSFASLTLRLSLVLV